MLHSHYLSNDNHICLGMILPIDYAIMNDAVSDLEYDGQVVSCDNFINALTNKKLNDDDGKVCICCTIADPLNSQQTKELFDLFRTHRTFLQLKSLRRNDQIKNMPQQLLDELTLGND